MGREFLEVFEGWADSYDSTVAGHDQEYKEVFARYDDILNDVVQKSGHIVLEFGVGTGNLTQRLLNENKKVYGIEPSKPMREIALQKLHNYQLLIEDGDFLDFKRPSEQIDTIVSTYAFHHLNDSEKEQAIGLYSMCLQKGGKIVFADTIFEDKQAYTQMIAKCKEEGLYNLAEDLEREYYTTVDVLTTIFRTYSFEVSFKRFNDFVLVLEAVKL